jgi:hypothetical protein
MRTNANRRRYRLRAGAHTMATWVGHDQVIYMAVRGETGWVVGQKVADAGVVVLS